MLKNSAEREELNRRRKQLLALDADVCFAVAALDGGVVSWLKYMVDERKMVFDTQELSAERINCTQATLRLLEDDSGRQLLIDGLRNELSSQIAEHKRSFGTLFKLRSRTPR